MHHIHRLALITLPAAMLVTCPPRPASAQTFEAVGSRALGMGGAFVAVADDSSATWWNPAGLAAGPFLDLALGAGTADIEEQLPAHRSRTGWFALGTPPFGVSYYRLRITDIGALRPNGQVPGDRQDGAVEVPARVQSVSQFGATLVQTLFQDLHAGATLKYLRGSQMEARYAAADLAPPRLLEQAGDLETGPGEGAFDLDVGVIAVRGPLRLGGVVRNVREVEVGGAALPRMVRLGAAVDAGAVGAWPLTVAVDADLRSYQTASGDRRVVAVGGESWWPGRRVGVRAGARFNTAGATERVWTAGASAAIRTGLYLDGYVAQGGERGESGWGIAARASF